MNSRLTAKLCRGQILAMVLGLTAVLASSMPARAQYTMAQLVALGNTGVTVGGEHFYDFQYSSDAFKHSGFANAPTALQLMVNFTAFVGGPPAGGVIMSMNPLGLFAGNTGVADINFSFKVDAAPNWNLVRTTHTIGGSATGAGLATMDETITGVVPGGLTRNLHAQKNGGGPAFASAVFTPRQHTIADSEHLSTSGLHQGDSGNLSMNTQIFYEAPIPEPASIATLTLGALGLCGFRFCRKKKSST
jgi:hypothetical protein